MDKIARDPNIKLRNMLIEMDHPKAGKLKVANSPIRLSQSPNDKITPAPLLGEYTDEVLQEILAMSKEEIRELRGRGWFEEKVIMKCK